MLDAHTRLLSTRETMQWRTDIGGETNEHKLVITSKDHHCLCEFLNVVGDWIVWNYYAPEMFTDGRPARKHLDERYPDTPVLVRDTSLHKVPLSTEDPRELEWIPKLRGQFHRQGSVRQTSRRGDDRGADGSSSRTSMAEITNTTTAKNQESDHVLK